MTELLEKVYLCCMVAGLAIPLFHLIAGGVGSALDFDFDFDFDGALDGLLPLNLMGIAFFAVLFGAIGRLCLHRMNPWLSLLAGTAAGLCGWYLLGRFLIRPLHAQHSAALRMQQLRWQEGTVKLEIRRDFVGTITVLSSVGSLITYSARPIAGVDKIEVGERVMIVEVDEKERICTVSPLGDGGAGILPAG
ncbi:MAG: hypothetical protein HFG27_04335 [Provencibacterium sp.]|nr:hypothetical protein [Provencibacterium sp.]